MTEVSELQLALQVLAQARLEVKAVEKRYVEACQMVWAASTPEERQTLWQEWWRTEYRHAKLLDKNQPVARYKGAPAKFDAIPAYYQGEPHFTCLSSL